MSFHIVFAARTAYSAKEQLNKVNAPAIVKALIATALDAVPWPAPKPQQTLAIRRDADAATDRMATDAPPITRHTGIAGVPAVFGVLVEAWGHLAEPGDGNGATHFEQFRVLPLTEHGHG